MSINRVEITGNLGKDPELKATAGGTSVLLLSVCVNSRVKRDGEWADKANWVDVKFFGSRADALHRYLSKGSHVAVAGRLLQETWEKDGQKRSRLVVVGEDIDMYGGAKKDEPEADPYDEDIPF